MARKGKQKPTRRMEFRRRHEGKTNYGKRLRLLKSGKPRMVVRRSLRYIRVQIVEYDEGGDKTVAAITSQTLKKFGWEFAFDSTPAAYLTGIMIGKVAQEKKISEAILDIGLYPSTKGSRLYAVIKGAVDAGLNVPHDAEMLPDESRIRGEHIASHNEKFKRLPEHFDVIKEKIVNEKIINEKNVKEKTEKKK